MTAERLSTRVNSKELLKSSERHIGTDGILITMSLHLSSIFNHGVSAFLIIFLIGAFKKSALSNE